MSGETQSSCLTGCPEFTGAVCARATLFNAADTLKKTASGAPSGTDGDRLSELASHTERTAEMAELVVQTTRGVAESTRCKAPSEDGSCAQGAAMIAAREALQIAIRLNPLTQN